MNTNSEASPEMVTLKSRLKTVWESGDYNHFSTYLLPGALEFLERLNIPAGAKVLDIGCGAGQITIQMAKNGVDVTGVDLAQNLVDAGNEKARAEGLEPMIQQGDAEALPHPDESFDISLSLIGSMFAPRPELVASEMVRVTKPGGKVIMGNWTPEGHVGRMFKIIGQFAPPPPIFPSPVLWGSEEKVRERFGSGVSELTMTRRMYPFYFPFPPQDVAQFFIDFYGPTNKAFASLDDDNKAAFKEAITKNWEADNEATDGTTSYHAEYLEIIGTRA